MDDGGVRDDEFDATNIGVERDRTGTLASAILAKLDQALARQFLEPCLSEFLAKRFQREGRGAARRLADSAHVLNMKVDKILDGRGIDLCALDRCLSTVNAPFRRGSPLGRIFVAKKGFAHIGLLAADLDPSAAGGQSCASRHFFMCARCALDQRRGAKMRELECT